jgi:hypothetical protein
VGRRGSNRRTYTSTGRCCYAHAPQRLLTSIMRCCMTSLLGLVMGGMGSWWWPSPERDAHCQHDHGQQRQPCHCRAACAASPAARASMRCVTCVKESTATACAGSCPPHAAAGNQGAGHGCLHLPLFRGLRISGAVALHGSSWCINKSCVQVLAGCALVPCAVPLR